MGLTFKYRATFEGKEDVDHLDQRLLILSLTRAGYNVQPRGSWSADRGYPLTSDKEIKEDDLTVGVGEGREWKLKPE